ncbi:uncharacterized protein ALTATR162_LOCUS1154 [Alternaria atra]|jgi:hypothetical protein|uniref:F-box domain-containing protein n=1 Tax=Alternaria atra TaxID=119953 RepID=A0A8J2HTL5_9PLEO|nr:uncharacterized protein ALTATR162_LOCUS1154 [Alternaria atra]CAG5142451.1 unnamed protein product [Alternaria atra]
MDRIFSEATSVVAEHASITGQPRLVRLHDDNCSSSTPVRSRFPIPNELLDIVLEHVIRNNTSSYRDILTFLLTCRACNTPEFQKYIYRTVCFAPNPKSIAVLKAIYPVRANLVKALVYRDAAPQVLEVAERKFAGLSYHDPEFYRPCAHDRETNPCL